MRPSVALDFCEKIEGRKKKSRQSRDGGGRGESVARRGARSLALGREKELRPVINGEHANEREGE